MNQKEIEIKLLFKNKREIVSKLGSKMKFKKKINIYDKYYNRGNFDMSNIHSLLRIREIKDGDTELTYKGRAQEKKNIWHRVELTTKITSSREMEEILRKIGFNKISEYKSEKEYWIFNDLEIIFAKFTSPAYLEFMEIEGKSERKIKNTIQRLKDNVQEVGEEIFEVFDRKRND